LELNNKEEPYELKRVVLEEIFKYTNKG